VKWHGMDRCSVREIIVEEKPVYLRSIEFELGEINRIDQLEELQRQPESLRTLRALGLNSFSRCDGDIVAYAARCMTKVLHSAAVEAASVDALVYATNTFGHTEPHLDALKCAMYELGLHRAYPYGVSFSGCGNLQAGIRVATALVRGGHHRNILLVAADTASHSYSTQGSRIYSNNVSIFSDGAAACLVGAEVGQGKRGLYRWLCTEQVSDLSIVKHSRDGDWAEAMRCAESGVSMASQRALRAAGLQRADVRALITNNYNLSVSRLFGMAAGVSDSKVFSANLGRYGHVYSADGLINLASFAEVAHPRPGEKIMVLGSGPSTWGVSVLEYQN